MEARITPHDPEYYSMKWYRFLKVWIPFLAIASIIYALITTISAVQIAKNNPEIAPVFLNTPAISFHIASVVILAAFAWRLIKPLREYNDILLKRLYFLLGATVVIIIIGFIFIMAETPLYYDNASFVLLTFIWVSCTIQYVKRRIPLQRFDPQRIAEAAALAKKEAEDAEERERIKELFSQSDSANCTSPPADEQIAEESLQPETLRQEKTEKKMSVVVRKKTPALHTKNNIASQPLFAEDREEHSPTQKTEKKRASYAWKATAIVAILVALCSLVGIAIIEKNRKEAETFFEAKEQEYLKQIEEEVENRKVESVSSHKKGYDMGYDTGYRRGYLDCTNSVSNELDFYRSYAVIVPSGSNVYHTYKCPKRGSETFYIYNIANAEYIGYSPCPECFRE